MIEIRKTDQYTKWFSALNDRNAKARIDIRIRRLQLGNPGDVKPVGDRVSEMRINYGPGYRVYFIDLNGQLIVLLGGGDKGSQDRDIKKAIQLSKILEDRK
jgi:putative addiction module killer protein